MNFLVRVEGNDHPVDLVLDQVAGGCEIILGLFREEIKVLFDWEGGKPQILVEFVNQLGMDRVEAYVRYVEVARHVQRLAASPVPKLTRGVCQASDRHPQRRRAV